jgi:GATA zinc finger
MHSAIEANQRVKAEAGVVKRTRRPKVLLIHAGSVCANCHTTQASLWRRSPSGEPECK